MNEMNARHTITIDDRTYWELRSKGNFGETYSELISRIIKDSDVFHRIRGKGAIDG
jgi:predicted CopG family antitoxin